MAVRAVKGAQFAFIGAKRETLDRRSGRSRRRFSAGRAKEGNEWDNTYEWFAQNLSFIKWRDSTVLTTVRGINVSEFSLAVA